MRYHQPCHSSTQPHAFTSYSPEGGVVLGDHTHFQFTGFEITWQDVLHGHDANLQEHQCTGLAQSASTRIYHSITASWDALPYMNTCTCTCRISHKSIQNHLVKAHSWTKWTAKSFQRNIHNMNWHINWHTSANVGRRSVADSIARVAETPHWSVGHRFGARFPTSPFSWAVLFPQSLNK